MAKGHEGKLFIPKLVGEAGWRERSLLGDLSLLVTVVYITLPKTLQLVWLLANLSLNIWQLLYRQY